MWVILSFSLDIIVLNILLLQILLDKWQANFQILLHGFDSSDNKLFDAVSELRHEILLLTIQNEKLKQESLQLQNGQGSFDGKLPEKSSVICMIIWKWKINLYNWRVYSIVLDLRAKNLFPPRRID